MNLYLDVSLLFLLLSLTLLDYVDLLRLDKLENFPREDAVTLLQKHVDGEKLVWALIFSIYGFMGNVSWNF